MFLAAQDIFGIALPIVAGLLLGYLIATRGKNKNPNAVVLLSAEDFSKNMRKGQLIDIRSEEDWNNEKINGSRNFPKRSITRSLFKLRKDLPVFIYSDKGTGLIKSVANKLANKGFNPVYVLKTGFEEWPYLKKSGK